MKMKFLPDDDYRYWYFSPLGNGMMFFRTEKDRDAYASEDVKQYLDEEGWSDDVEGCCAGEVTHMAQESERMNRPTNPAKAASEGWPDDVDYKCNYAILPMGANA